MFMMSVKAATPLFMSATVTWVSSDAWVAWIMASVTLPWPAAACDSAVDAVFWVCWTWSRAWVIEPEKSPPLPAVGRPGGGRRRQWLYGRYGSDHRCQVPRVRADWYAVLASANDDVFAW